MIDPWLWVMLLGLSGLSLLAYALGVLDARGAVASFVLGLLLIAAGGIRTILLMATFTGIAFASTRIGRDRKRKLGLLDGTDGERSLSNVVGNGAAPALMALSGLFLDPYAAAVAFATAVAAIAADTMGSEVGCMSDRARSILPPFRRMEAGRNGAVSMLGQIATATGSLTIALAAWQLWDHSLAVTALIALGGFLGGQVDSVLGMTLERDYIRNDRPLGKQDVNFLASLIPSLVLLIALAVG